MAMNRLEQLDTTLVRLAPEQIKRLSHMFPLLQLAGDIAHANVTVYIPARPPNSMLVAAQVRPNTSLLRYRPSQVGCLVRAVEEPLVWRTMVSGEAVSGQREWALGQDRLDMYTFAVKDDAGAVIAVISFEGNSDEPASNGQVLLNAAYHLLLSVKEPPDPALYRGLTAHDGILIADSNGNILTANVAARSIYRVLGLSQLVGRRLFDRQLNMPVAHKALDSGRPQEAEIEVSNVILRQRAIPIWQDGNVVRIIGVIADVTALRQKEKELLVKSAVIREIHHRVKNNLQTIASLLRLQARRTQSADAKAALQESVNRILSISTVYEFLSQHDVEVINIAEIAQNILKLVVQNMPVPGCFVKTEFSGEAVILPSEQATSLALVINELVLNSLEHAFAGRKMGVVGVKIIKTSQAYQIEVYDDGVGLAAENIETLTQNSLGLQIVRTLVETDLGGRFSLVNQNGTRGIIVIPRIPKEV